MTNDILGGIKKDEMFILRADTPFIIKPKLVLIRGLPGSGKSTLALHMMIEGDYEHFEADMYFIEDGKYKFNPKRIKQAHGWCKLSVAVALSLDKNVIVSNTFTQLWEIEPYLTMAKKLGVDVEIKECKGNYKNIHSVPKMALDRMKARWEDLPEGLV